MEKKNKENNVNKKPKTKNKINRVQHGPFRSSTMGPFASASRYFRLHSKPKFAPVIEGVTIIFKGVKLASAFSHLGNSVAETAKSVNAFSRAVDKVFPSAV